MRTLALILFAAVAGCASAHPNAVAQTVRFTNSRDMVRGCTPLGIVESTDKTNGGAVAQMPVEDNPLRRLRNDAARLGANLVLLTDGPTGMKSDNIQRGEAFQCANPRGWTLSGAAASEHGAERGS